MWSVLQRDSEKDEFAVPEGWNVVEVNEDNFPQYASQVWIAKVYIQTCTTFHYKSLTNFNY